MNSPLLIPVAIFVACIVAVALAVLTNRSLAEHNRVKSQRDAEDVFQAVVRAVRAVHAMNFVDQCSYHFTFLVMVRLSRKDYSVRRRNPAASVIPTYEAGESRVDLRRVPNNIEHMEAAHADQLDLLVQAGDRLLKAQAKLLQTPKFVISGGGKGQPPHHLLWLTIRVNLAESEKQVDVNLSCEADEWQAMLAKEIALRFDAEPDWRATLYENRLQPLMTT